MKREPSRLRQGGTRVTRPASAAERIAAVRLILTDGFAKIDGVMVDLFSASAIVQVYDALNDSNRLQFASRPVNEMAGIAFELINRSQR